jgi:hypothetical protein
MKLFAALHESIHPQAANGDKPLPGLNIAALNPFRIYSCTDPKSALLVNAMRRLRVARAADLAAAIGVSQPTLSRLVPSLPGDLVRIGKARRDSAGPRTRRCGKGCTPTCPGSPRIRGQRVPWTQIRATVRPGARVAGRPDMLVRRCHPHRARTCRRGLTGGSHRRHARARGMENPSETNGTRTAGNRWKNDSSQLQDAAPVVPFAAPRNAERSRSTKQLATGSQRCSSSGQL